MHLAQILLVVAACAGTPDTTIAQPVNELAAPLPEGRSEAILAGGCFWCMESEFEAIEGVDDAVSGYTGGMIDHPTYSQVGSGLTGHTEAIRVIYDPKVVTYAELLEQFWINIDPTQMNGQFCDRGTQYRAALFPANAEELALAEQTKAAAAERLGVEITTTIEPYAPFYVAEEYHQDFYKKDPAHYRRYRLGCGRDARLAELWGTSTAH